MAETKVKATPKAAKAKTTPNGKATPSKAAVEASELTETVKQPDQGAPNSNEEAKLATGAPKATSPAEPEFSKEQYLAWYEQMQLMRKFEEKAGQLYGQQKNQGFLSSLYWAGSLRGRRGFGLN